MHLQNRMDQQEFLRRFNSLSFRRRQVLLKVLAGETNRAIAKLLQIEESTVRKHIEKICEIFGLKNEFGERFSKRPDLITLFSHYQPELVNIQKPKAIQVTRSTFDTIYDRDVFILIDQSGSMVRKDTDTGNLPRYEYLQEIVEGHVFAMLSDHHDRKICDQVSVYFFNRNPIASEPAIVTSADQVQTLFKQNPPRNNTIVSPTLQKCLNTWLSKGKPEGRGAFILIYTDGLFNDEADFIKCISRACTQIKDHREAKIFVLGIGHDIDIHHFLEIDFNTVNQMPFDIFVFELVNEFDDILELLKRQLIDTPHSAIPAWVKQRYPEFAQKIIQIYGNSA